VEVVVHQDERVQRNAVIAESSAEQAPEVVAVVRIEEDRALVDAAMRDMLRDTWQLETRQSWHGSGCEDTCCQCAATERSDLSAGMPVAWRRALNWSRPHFPWDDLRIPPANRLEALKGGRKGQHSIRINDQWRICFRWVDGDAHDVEIVDYH
jgi:proteic killer suppression protein